MTFIYNYLKLPEQSFWMSEALTGLRLAPGEVPHVMSMILILILTVILLLKDGLNWDVCFCLDTLSAHCNVFSH